MTAKKKPKAPAASNLARLFPDHPADQEVLKFEFEGLAKTLAELALNPDNRTPFTAVVRGGWGRGKTTLLRRTQRLLAKPSWIDADVPVRRVETLWFNAWKYSDEDTVLAGLLGELFKKFRTGDLLKQVKDVVLRYRGPAAVAVLRAAAPGPLKGIFDAEDSFAPVHEKRAFHDTFRDLFSEVSYTLFTTKALTQDTGGRSEEVLWDEEMQGKATLAVLLDDLDRCSQKRVLEVLQAINLFLDLPGVCFYLGVDRPRLIERLPPEVRGQGEDFLEKIVQVAFDLPEVSEKDAESYVGELVAGTTLADILQPGEDGGPGDLAVLSGALNRRHPRHVKRFLNDLSMGLAVLRNTDKLGEESPRVPETAVLAWHLLSEILPEERWHEVRALKANLDRFLSEWDAPARDDEAGAAGEGAETLSRLRQSRLLERHLEVLRQLDADQIRSLNLASPADEPKRPRHPGGRGDLFDLRSDAWVELPGGEFEMGSEDGESHETPVHRVKLSPFKISRYPVTNLDYARYVRSTRREVPEHWKGGEIPEGKENHPVVNVSWSDAEAFCTWLSKELVRAEPAGSAHLPTEAQWEYAARGLEGRVYPWGDEDPTEEHANFGIKVGDTTPVDSYPRGASPEGIHDLAGNVWEWCRDRYGDYPKEKELDPTGPSSGSSRVLRGGSWDGDPFYLRSAYRIDIPPETRLDFIGFRVLWSSGGLA